MAVSTKIRPRVGLFCPQGWPQTKNIMGSQPDPWVGQTSQVSPKFVIWPFESVCGLAGRSVTFNIGMLKPWYLWFQFVHLQIWSFVEKAKHKFKSQKMERRQYHFKNQSFTVLFSKLNLSWLMMYSLYDNLLFGYCFDDLLIRFHYKTIPFCKWMKIPLPVLNCKEFHCTFEQ